MKWEVLYGDWTVFDSDWASLPQVGVIKVTIIFPDNTRVVWSGWDVYWIDEGEGLTVGVWKDDDPEDPFYRKGHARTYREGSNVGVDTGYLPMETWDAVPAQIRKRGVWVDDATARAMGV